VAAAAVCPGPGSFIGPLPSRDAACFG